MRIDRCPNIADTASRLMPWYRYPGCDGDVEMLRYEITGGGHVWPGGVPGSREMGSITSNLSGASATWELLRPYQR